MSQNITAYYGMVKPRSVKMTDTYAAYDYGSISQGLKDLEARRSEPQETPETGKWGIWVNAHDPKKHCWAYVIGPLNWRSTGPNALDTTLRPTLYATKAEAQALIDVENENFRIVCEAREYPE